MGAERWDEQVGSVADEASRLLESLRRTAAESAAGASAADDGPDAAGPAPAADAASATSSESAAGESADPGGMPGASPAPGPEPSGHDPFCTWCPLCRGAAVVRSLSPETLAKLADLATLAATVLAELASSRSGGGPTTRPPSRPPPPRGRPNGPGARGPR